MVKLGINFVNLIERFAISVWGFTLIDLLAVFDFNLLETVDENIKTFLVYFGAVYFVIKTIFSIIEKYHKKKYNDRVREIQEVELRIKQKEAEMLELRRDYHEQNRD